MHCPHVELTWSQTTPVSLGQSQHSCLGSARSQRCPCGSPSLSSRAFTQSTALTPHSWAPVGGCFLVSVIRGTETFLSAPTSVCPSVCLYPTSLSLICQSLLPGLWTREPGPGPYPGICAHSQPGPLLLHMVDSQVQCCQPQPLKRLSSSSICQGCLRQWTAGSGHPFCLAPTYEPTLPGGELRLLPSLSLVIRDCPVAVGMSWGRALRWVTWWCRLVGQVAYMGSLALLGLDLGIPFPSCSGLLPGLRRRVQQSPSSGSWGQFCLRQHQPCAGAASQDVEHSQLQLHPRCIWSLG